MSKSVEALPLAKRSALAAGVLLALGSFVSAPAAWAQQAEATDVDTVEVTGTRITRTAVDGPLPVTVIGRDDIVAAGDVSVSDFLQRQTFNSFGSFTGGSGFAGGAQGGSVLSLRGLGSFRTLVLIDGRRIANNPAFAGAAQNLNTLPLANVERIEILREGASAVYGSDAIGGVINIITRKDFTGVEISSQIERPTQDGADGAYASFMAGMAGTEGRFVVTADHFQRAILLRNQRDYLDAQEPSPLGGPGSFYRVADRSAPTSGIRPSPNIPGAVVEPFASCPDAFGVDPDNPSSARFNFPLFTGDDVLCLYKFTDVAGQTAEVKRDTVSFAGDMRLTDAITGFTRVQATRASSFGRFAAAPVTPVFGGLTMAADNANNPTAGEADGPSDIVILFRPVAAGPRDSVVEDTITQFLFGVTGELPVAGNSEWELTAFDNRYAQSDTGFNNGLRSNLQQIIDTERFNPFDPDPEQVGLFAITLAGSNLFNSRGADIRLNFDDLLGGAGLRLPLAVGGEYREERFHSLSDQQADAGNVFGTAGGSAAGDREYFAFYAESLLAFMDNRIELGFALRYDDYSDFGNELSPKVSAAFRPIDMLLFRGSFGEGFRAPDLEILFRAPAQSFPTGQIDRLGCAINPDDPFACDGRQRETFLTNNPNLQPELSENWNLGVVFNPLPELTLTLDYYNIEIDDGIGTLTAQNVLDNDFTCFQEGRTCDPGQEGTVIRARPGPPEQNNPNPVILVLRPAANFTETKTDGLDFEGRYALDTPVGRLGFDVNVSYVLGFERSTAPESPLEEVTRSVAVPKWRSINRASWALGDFSSTLVLNHIDRTKDCTIAQLNQTPVHPNCDRKVGSFTTWDLQAGWNAPWGGELVVGARNLFDRDPPLSFTLGVPTAPETDMSVYSIFGRVPYLRYTQRF